MDRVFIIHIIDYPSTDECFDVTNVLKLSRDGCLEYDTWWWIRILDTGISIFAQISTFTNIYT